MASDIKLRRPLKSGKTSSGRVYLFHRTDDAYLDKADRQKLHEFRERVIARVQRETADYFDAAGVLFIVLLFERRREALETVSRSLPLPEGVDPRINGHVVMRLKQAKLLKRAGTGESQFDSSNHGLRNLWRLQSEQEAFIWLQQRADWLVSELGIPNPAKPAATTN